MNPKQRQLLELAENKMLRGRSLRAIGEMIEGAHPQTVRHHLQQLVRRGLLTPERELCKENYERKPYNRVPVLRYPIGDQQHEGYLYVSKRIIENVQNCYAIQVTGNDIDGAAINDVPIRHGNFVVVNPTKKPKSGDLVVVFVDGAAKIREFITQDTSDIVQLLSKSQKNCAQILITRQDIDDPTFFGGVIVVALGKYAQ